MAIPTTYTWYFGDVEGGAGGEPASGTAGGNAQGEDIWFDLTAADTADRVVTPAGDWKMVAGETALRQSLMRRTITDPGEWSTVPGYGVGAQSFVYEARTQAKIDELKARIRAQYMRDPRVVRVVRIQVDTSSPDMLYLEIDVWSRLRSDAENPMKLRFGVR
jgi:hypothetical protein